MRYTDKVSKKVMNIAGIIPARMGSSRFPGKPLMPILGKPMIAHVLERSSQSSRLTSIAVATCDIEIYNYIHSIGGTAVLTSKDHERASDRCAEALIKLEKKNRLKYDIVVMIQGDEPMIHPNMISEAVDPMIADPTINIVNLLGEIKDQKEFEDRNCIKVVCDLDCNAMYFSREPIPSRFMLSSVPMGKQVCVIPFRRDCLVNFTNLKPTPLEIAESVDMMRALENGMKVRMVPTSHKSYAVDTLEDLKRVEDMLRIKVG